MYDEYPQFLIFFALRAGILVTEWIVSPAENPGTVGVFEQQPG